jgi:polysaccharide biosynthesis transport protein
MLNTSANFSGDTSVAAVSGVATPPRSSPINGAAAALPSLMRYWRIVLRWRWVIAAIVTVAFIVGLIITLLMTPRYTATATIEISRQQDKIVQVQDVRPESSAVDLEFYQTQYALLKARSLAEQVADELKLADSVAFLKMFNVKLEGSGVFLSMSPDQMGPAKRNERKRKVVEVLLDHIGIAPIRGSRLVDVSFTSADANLSAQIANAWVKQFIATNLARRFDASSYARSFLESRLGKLREKLEESERQVVAYADAQRIISVPASDRGSGSGADRPIVAEDLSALNTALAEATADRIRMQSAQGKAGSGANTEALQNSAISALRQKRAEVASEYAKMLVQYEPQYPAARALSDQVTSLDRAIVREESRVIGTISNNYRGAVARENALKRRVEDLKNDLLNLKRRSIQYNIFQRDADTNRQLYDGLLQRYKEIGVAGGVGTNNVSIVDDADVPEKPSSPRLLLNLLLALLGGAIVAAVCTFVLEQIDETIKDPSEATQTTGLPLLGTIPNVPGGEVSGDLKDRKSAPSEAYLSLQTNLQFATDHGVPRSLAITSTRPGEGKSTTAYAIALSLTRTARNVVLVDCDMRSPSIHNLTGLENDRGVSSFLAGDDVLDTMVKSDSGSEVSVIVAGACPPNAAELLSGPRLSLLLERLLERFDHVIIDSPPVVGLADAPLIGSKVEGIIYVAQANGARASLIRAGIERLRNSSTRILGLVLTKFEAKQAHYGYGYDYGYGYGSENATTKGN